MLSVLRWRQIDKNRILGFWLVNILFYPVTSNNIFIDLLVTLVSVELIYLDLGGSLNYNHSKGEESVTANIVDLMNLNTSVIATVFNEDRRYDFSIHNGKYEDRNSVYVSVSKQHVSDLLNSNIVKAKQMLNVRELSGDCIFGTMTKVDLRDLKSYRKNTEVMQVCEVIEQEQFIFKSYLDNRIDLIKDQLQNSYSLVGLDETRVVDYTQEIMSNKIKVEQRFNNLQALVDQLVIKLKTS